MMTAVVLAAGKSERMGSPKALMKFGDRTCLRLVLDTIFDSYLNHAIVVLGSEGQRVFDEAGLAELDNVDAIINEGWELGQTSSVKAAITQFKKRTDSFLLFPVDFPLVTPETIRALVDLHLKRNQGTGVIVPSYQNRRGHPVIIEIDAMRRSIMALPDEKPLSDVLFRDPQKVEYVNVETDEVVRDMDSPDDYEHIKKTWEQRLSKA
ncbi:MAG: nucleotidyltransferase family protein [Planctomycetota bacterium]